MCDDLWFSTFSDSTFTVDSVTDVMEKVTVDKRRQVWMKVVGLGGSSHIEEIYNTHSSEKQKTHACSDMYVNCHPESSWEHLASRLYQEDAMVAVGQARLFLPPRGKQKLLTPCVYAYHMCVTVNHTVL